MIRAIITQNIESELTAIKRFSASGRPGEIIPNREHLQHYGLTSRPLPGAEGIVIGRGNHLVMIASDDRRYRFRLGADGEVAIYSWDGSRVYLRSGGRIEIRATTEVKVMAPSVKVGNELTIDTAAGVVTQQCACAVTGAIHPVVSGTVKATL